MEAASGIQGMEVHWEDEALRAFYNTTCLHIVPALNVDGMLLGNHRYDYSKAHIGSRAQSCAMLCAAAECLLLMVMVLMVLLLINYWVYEGVLDIN